MNSLEKLLEVMASLRDAETGCAWDLQQNYSTIAPYTIEEAYEVADAIARDDMAGLKDELGDLLFQVVFYARMAEEQRIFDFEAVAAGICDKMVRRHPHVFGNDQERERGPVSGAWEQIKAAERAAKSPDNGLSALDGVAISLPALKRAQKLGKRAASAGFDWPDTRGVRAKIAEEIAELSAAECAGKPQEVADELGDLLFAVVNLARHLNVDSEQALSDASRKFERRFRSMEIDAQQDNVDFAELDIDALESRWQEAKKKT
jgi:nucleoside triphosphate diphosphatase